MRHYPSIAVEICSEVDGSGFCPETACFNGQDGFKLVDYRDVDINRAFLARHDFIADYD